MLFGFVAAEAALETVLGVTSHSTLSVGHLSRLFWAVLLTGVLGVVDLQLCEVASRDISASPPDKARDERDRSSQREDAGHCHKWLRIAAGGDIH